jgi:uncharacterized protein
LQALDKIRLRAACDLKSFSCMQESIQDGQICRFRHLLDLDLTMGQIYYIDLDEMSMRQKYFMSTQARSNTEMMRTYRITWTPADEISWSTRWIRLCFMQAIRASDKNNRSPFGVKCAGGCRNWRVDCWNSEHAYFRNGTCQLTVRAMTKTKLNEQNNTSLVCSIFCNLNLFERTYTSDPR